MLCMVVAATTITVILKTVMPIMMTMTRAVDSYCYLSATIIVSSSIIIINRARLEDLCMNDSRKRDIMCSYKPDAMAQSKRSTTTAL